ncbi:hypothetical protein [Alteromonas sp. 14N.309.X.WAT.G.H12]|uniref:hypothetical protein n=1 Tax=Alteromonas sp. 14N.309.X.WAT.G.H12 TaxID=3120824 RepID=UPI002FD3A2E3
MANRYQAICQDVAKLLERGDFERAANILAKYQDVRDTYIAQAYYRLYSDMRSHYYSEEKAIVRLDFLEKAKDQWGVIEKGRCLLEGELFQRNTFMAEDLFNAAIRAGGPLIDHAKYYLGLIASNGLHSQGDENAPDLHFAKKMFSEVMGGTSKYKELARKEYCRTFLKEKEFSAEEHSQLFTHLYTLYDADRKGGAELYSEYLLSSLESLGKELYSHKGAPSGLTQRAEFDARKNELRKALVILRHTLQMS